MKSILDVQLQKLFLITLVLKVASSFLGWYLVSPWVLGFAVPLLIMGCYIGLGYFRHNSDVTDEKFADSCYYLGFIFTITSIIFSLFDLPYIGTRIQDIAVRFGAAMVSTVFGLAVRVYLVSFKEDASDALKNAEQAVLDATRILAEHLRLTVDRLKDFESQVDSATRSSVEHVNLQIENLSKNHAEKLAAFFSDLSAQNQTAFTSALAEVKTASQRLTESVDGYSLGMRSNLASIEAKVTGFAEAVTDRLNTTTFPDDYFAKRLEIPLSHISDSANAFAGQVKQVSAGVAETSTLISRALKKLSDKAEATGESLDTVLRLTSQQQAVLDSAEAQLATLDQMTATLTSFHASLDGISAGIEAGTTATSQLTNALSIVIEDGVATRQHLDGSLGRVFDRLDASTAASNRVATELQTSSETSRASISGLAERLEKDLSATSMAVQALATRMEVSTAANASVSSALDAVANTSSLLATKLDRMISGDEQLAVALESLAQHALSAIERTEAASGCLQERLRQFSSLDSLFQAQSIELQAITNRIRDIKVVVELAPQSMLPNPYSSHSESIGAPRVIALDPSANASDRVIRISHGPAFNHGPNPQEVPLIAQAHAE